jgi:hypothetical protein
MEDCYQDKAIPLIEYNTETESIYQMIVNLFS